ncbi:MAG TPA: inner-membrane translocator [Gammaproteobacteria bacterium]|nr:inner-membrane translocator [Gammaproteobacteria bacterium]|tara:strand:- start:53 stop:463 length:411 start_codon:yes stop_codon:yes gene_type:complete
MPRKTGVQENRGHTSTDDFITRTYILPILADKERRKSITDEHRANPIGKPGLAGKAGVGHSEDLRRVLDKFRRAPQAGKYVMVQVKAHADYRIGIASGVRGKPLRMLPKSFASQDDCEHGIFLKRVKDIMTLYGVR